MQDPSETVGDGDHCETCSELLDRKEDFDLPEDNVLLIDVDVKVINPPPGNFGKKERQEKRKNFVDKLKKFTSALRNTAGGIALVHLQGLTSEDKSLDYFHETVDVKLNDMIEDGSLFVQSYQKDWLLDDQSRSDNNSQFQGFVAIHVIGSRILTTFNFNSKQPLDNSVIDVQSNVAIQFLKRKNCFKDKRPSIRGIPQINERRNIQLKRFDTAKEHTLQSVHKFSDYLWEDCRLGRYISAFSKLNGGGSFFLGINEDDMEYGTYNTKRFSTAGIKFRASQFRQETEAAIYRSLQANTVIVTYSGERLETPLNTIQVAFHPVDADKHVLEVAVAAVDGLLCHDKEGPEAYEYENSRLKRLSITEWHKSSVLISDCLSRLMAMLKSSKELSQKDDHKWLDENLRDVPVERVDKRGLYQKRTPCKQIERSLQDIEAKFLQAGPHTMEIFPKGFPEEKAYVNLKTRLNELSDNVGLAYVAKSLPVTANMDIKYKTPGEVIMDVCLFRQRSPAVILSVVRDMSEEMKIQTQRYNSAVSKELTKNARKFTTMTFNCLYGLVHEKKLMSKETFESCLTRIEKERSRLCVPESLSMYNEKYKSVICAFLSSVAATEFVSDENDETLWFLTHKQFSILTENIDHTEVHVDTFPYSGGRVLSLTVSQRLQKLGQTLLISDDDKLIKRARNRSIECKTIRELGQSDLAAKRKGFLYVVIYEGGEDSLSQVPYLHQLLEAAQKLWVFHRRKGLPEDKDVLPNIDPLARSAPNFDRGGLEEDLHPSRCLLVPSLTRPDDGEGFLEREIRMVLVGKPGAGKSATGNTICGAGKGTQIFQAVARAMSVTKNCKQHCFKRFGYDLQLVDVPGFWDTSISDEHIKREIMKCVGMSSPGIHAILFIVRIGRFTEEDKNTLERFLQCFGQEAKRFVIVVFIGKDDLEEAGETIDNYLGDIPMKLKQFLYETSLRYIAVNNRGTNEEKEKFTKDLIGKVRRMVDENGGQCYKNEMYERCEADLQEAERKEKLEEKRQKLLDEKLKQEAAAWQAQVQIQHIQIQEMWKQLEKERKERDEADQLRKQLQAVELRQKKEEERKRLEEEKRRQAEENRIREFQRQVDVKQKQMEEEFERRKEELRLEEARKQIRGRIEDDDTSYFQRFLGGLRAISHDRLP